MLPSRCLHAVFLLPLRCRHVVAFVLHPSILPIAAFLTPLFSLLTPRSLLLAPLIAHPHSTSPNPLHRPIIHFPFSATCTPSPVARPQSPADSFPQKKDKTKKSVVAATAGSKPAGGARWVAPVPAVSAGLAWWFCALSLASSSSPPSTSLCSRRFAALLCGCAFLPGCSGYHTCFLILIISALPDFTCYWQISALLTSPTSPAAPTFPCLPPPDLRLPEPSSFRLRTHHNFTFANSNQLQYPLIPP